MLLVFLLEISTFSQRQNFFPCAVSGSFVKACSQLVLTLWEHSVHPRGWLRLQAQRHRQQSLQLLLIPLQKKEHLNQLGRGYKKAHYCNYFGWQLCSKYKQKPFFCTIYTHFHFKTSCITSFVNNKCWKELKTFLLSTPRSWRDAIPLHLTRY